MWRFRWTTLVARDLFGCTAISHHQFLHTQGDFIVFVSRTMWAENAGYVKIQIYKCCSQHTWGGKVRPSVQTLQWCELKLIQCVYT
jgi:hypothetical protein